ncbi:MAG: ACP S-malonyltransferase [Pseudomonadales bacterium]|nr:ACP S-malonyltransferase [Pseudomonadales bacterium]NRA17809.1 ACP S-malonyltransferase [Oceanospirillaceae bacterium]
MSQSNVFVFPGQGSQQLGMLAELAAENPIIEQTFAEASAVLGYDLWLLVQNGPAEELNQTDKTQPALLCSSVALWRLWQQKGAEQPAIMAGHSLGEYSALVCAGALGFADAIDLVRLRGEYMQQAVPAGTGAMAAILGLADELVEAACAQAQQGQVVAAVNYNCPGQVVIAGEKDAVARAIENCRASGAKRAIELPVSVPSHCQLMKPAAEKLAAKLQTVSLQMPQIPVLQNVTAREPLSVEQIKENLIAQLYSPVLWTASMQEIVGTGVTRSIECGPGKVLSGLNKKIHKPLILASLADAAGWEKATS